MDKLQAVLETVDDQVTFVKFLHALREDYERTERECQPYPQHYCAEEDHWESRSILDFPEVGRRLGGRQWVRCR